MRSSKSQALPFERRTLIVWGSLVASLSVVSGLLMALGPQPHAPAVGRVLTVLDPSRKSLDDLFATDAAVTAGRWKAIVVQHSEQSHGNAETLGNAHQEQGLGGLKHHFVIGNGEGAEDGEIQAGYRWPRQLDGASVAGVESAAWFNRHAVTVCLVGNGDRTKPSHVQVAQLVKLVRELQQRFGIPADRVYLQRDVVPGTTNPGLKFPVAEFRQQLLDVELTVGSR